MAHYFASDVHLRFDRPDRDVRFANWLSRLTPDDSLLIAGDLCDFWMASRTHKCDLLESTSLRRLAEFKRMAAPSQSCPATTMPGFAPSTSTTWLRESFPIHMSSPCSASASTLCTATCSEAVPAGRRGSRALAFSAGSVAFQIRSPARSTAPHLEGRPHTYTRRGTTPAILPQVRLQAQGSSRPCRDRSCSSRHR